MCGIAGILLSPRSSDARSLPEIAARMAGSLSHRGPDAQTTWVDQEARVALAHTRLSIIDLSPAGAQPMVSADGRYVIIYNGEVYEHDAIRARLVARGVKFRGYSDTELILESVANFGLQATLDHLVGMFAIALWDRKERTLTLVRDRFGIKPLYYGEQNGTFIFCSELKSLFAWPGFRPEIDRDALAGYFRFNYVPAPMSIWRGVSKLPPGHHITIGPEGLRQPVRWWDLRSLVAAGVQSPRSIAASDAEEELDRLLRKAVGLRMVADVPLGAFLSGGIDSSTVVAQMQAQSSRPVKTFTIGFDEAAYDESDHAAAVARHLGTDHTSLKVSPAETISVIPDLPTWYDEPFADSSQIPTYLVSRLARQSVTVALSGDGGDELFAGYNRYVWGELLWRRVGSLPLPARRMAAAAVGAVPSGLWDAVEGVPGTPRLLAIKAEKLASVLRLRDPGDVYRRLVAAWPDPEAVVPGGHAGWGVLEDEATARAVPPLVERMQYLDAVTYLPDDILTKVDRASMAVALEARVPLLDHRVAAFAFSLPRALRMQAGSGKLILRNVLARYLPRSMFERAKTGFGIPVGQWLRGPLRDWAEALLTPQALAASGLADAPVRRMWEEHRAGKISRDTEMWIVLMYQAWHARWSKAGVS